MAPKVRQKFLLRLALVHGWLFPNEGDSSKLFLRNSSLQPLDDCQITHLICVRLRHLLYDFLGGVLGLLYKKTTGRRPPKTPPKKSYSKCFRRTQIR